ncbi:MAG: methyltransferase domain-containing protein [Solirubrobacteraceae bacterium]|nr:methyltransferase domain-containing protein [Solirubrobacteraceae bacterium]
MDAEDYRADSRERWERAAAGWTARREQLAADPLPVSERLVERLDPQPGQRLLEVAAGLGDTGLLAAERVRPGGTVVITDGAEAMVEAAREHAAGTPGVEHKAMEAEWLDADTASFDGILSRWGYMLVADPEAALREARRVLRPGGRIAFAVWDEIVRNPWIGVLQEQLVAVGLAEPPRLGVPGMFGLASVVEPVEFAFHADDADAWWEHSLTVSISLGEALGRLSPAEHYALRDAVDAGYAAYTDADGRLTLPACSLVASADA